MIFNINIMHSKNTVKIHISSNGGIETNKPIMEF